MLISRYQSLIFLFCFLSTVVRGQQEIVCSDADRAAFEEKIGIVLGLQEHPKGDLLVAVGKTFMGIPYVAKTLEVGNTERLVVNLHGLDCTTFVENVLAFTWLKELGKKDFNSFTRWLEKIRYRDGQRSGYGSRLHYFTDWIRDNQKKGLLRDISNRLGGTPIEKPINFMSAHRDLYPFLAEDENFRDILEIENRINQAELCVVSNDTLIANEQLLQSGDIIALATSIDGLDVTHAGFATRQANGRIHLLHASTSGGVEISKLPLVDYLKNIKYNIGVIVARPVFNSGKLN